jgi:hypothetical protein
MRDRYEPPADPGPWPAIPPVYRARGADSPPAFLARDAGPYADPDWDPQHPGQFDGPADEARNRGLRRLSMLTVHASGLSVVTAIGFATMFAAAAHAQTGAAVAARPTLGPATAPGTPSPGPTHKPHTKKHHHHQAAPAGPGAGPSTAAAPAPAAPASSPALAPPATPPAPAPASSPPPQTTSSGSVAP